MIDRLTFTCGFVRIVQRSCCGMHCTQCDCFAVCVRESCEDGADLDGASFKLALEGDWYIFH